MVHFAWNLKKFHKTLDIELMRSIANSNITRETSWARHKKQPWILSGLNQSCSMIPSKIWKKFVNHTNLIEGIHAMTNRSGIKVGLNTAIEDARKSDLLSVQAVQVFMRTRIRPSYAVTTPISRNHYQRRERKTDDTVFKDPFSEPVTPEPALKKRKTKTKTPLDQPEDLDATTPTPAARPLKSSKPSSKVQKKALEKEQPRLHETRVIAYRSPTPGPSTQYEIDQTDEVDQTVDLTSSSTGLEQQITNDESDEGGGSDTEDAEVDQKVEALISKIEENMR
ncbi:hypothetical protein N7451_011581 [Penicillium sp. IBT 35674x]|nr:hypothetical protein N7451_011581 [Penicillium sp. IBT 35674x]